MKQDLIKSEVEKTIDADNSIPNLNINPFLYERVKAELGRKSKSSENSASPQFKIVQVLLIVLLAANLVTMYFLFDTKNTRTTHDKLIHELKKDFQIETAKNIF